MRRIEREDREISRKPRQGLFDVNGAMDEGLSSASAVGRRQLLDITGDENVFSTPRPIIVERSSSLKHARDRLNHVCPSRKICKLLLTGRVTTGAPSLIEVYVSRVRG